MPNKKTNLFLYIEVNGDAEYDVIPSLAITKQGDYYVHEIPHDYKQRQPFKVKVKSISSGGNLQIKKITSNNRELQNWQIWSTNAIDGKVVSTYGFMNHPGEYRFKMRYSPLVHNYITYFLSRCTSTT